MPSDVAVVLSSPSLELTGEEEDKEDVCSTRDVVASIAVAVGVVVVVVGISDFGTGLVMLEEVDGLRVAASELIVAGVVAELAVDFPFPLSAEGVPLGAVLSPLGTPSVVP